MDKMAVFERERAKLTEIFANVDESKKKLVEGLIQEASFLLAENQSLRQLMQETGMLKVHPTNKSLQKQTEAGKQYLKNVNSYAVIIKTLNGILNKNMIEDEDELSEFE